MQENTEKVVIDLTPCWRSVMPALLAVIQDGTPEGKRSATQELRRMAQLLDTIGESFKRAKEYDRAMNAAEKPPTGDDYNALLSLLGIAG